MAGEVGEADERSALLQNGHNEASEVNLATSIFLFPMCNWSISDFPGTDVGAAD